MTGLENVPWVARIPIAALMHGGGRTYERSQTDSETTDCSRLVYAVLVMLYGLAVIKPLQAAIKLYAGEDLWAPVLAMVRLGAGQLVSSPVPGRWHLVQGWRTPWKSGHTFFWYEPLSPLGGPGIQVQANEGIGAFVELDESFSEQLSRYTYGVRIIALDDMV